MFCLFKRFVVILLVTESSTLSSLTIFRIEETNLDILCSNNFKENFAPAGNFRLINTVSTVNLWDNDSYDCCYLTRVWRWAQWLATYGTCQTTWTLPWSDKTRPWTGSMPRQAPTSRVSRWRTSGPLRLWSKLRKREKRTERGIRSFRVHASSCNIHV